MRNKILLLLTVFVSLFASFFSDAYAGIVPGTLYKGSYTSANSCNTSTNSYSPSGGYCQPRYCKVFAQGSSSACGACTSYQQDANTCTVTNGSLCGYGTCTGTGCVPPANTCTVTNAGACGTHNGACLAYPTCRDSSFGCETYYQDPITTGTLTFTNYLYNNQNPSYGMSGDSRKLTQDTPQTCNRWADGTYHTAPNRGGVINCADGSDTYYINGSDGVCNQHGSTDNLVSYFNQVGSVSRASQSDADSTCTVEGRYGTADDIGPSIGISNVTGVFDGDQDNWCNYAKYVAGDYGTASNPELLGCKYYKDKASHATSVKNPDLLENMEVTVDDASGVSEVTVEIGSCTTTYSLANGVGSVVLNTESASGVKPGYKSLTFKYKDPSTSGGGAPGAGLPSLLSQFGRTRLDQCLVEGKNFIRVTAKDQARSDNDGTSYAPNTAVLDYSSSTKFLKIDNTTAKLGLSGNAAKVAESAAPSACYVGGIVIESAGTSWKNFTIKGGVQSTDPFGNNLPECNTIYTNVQKVGRTCTTSISKGPKPSVSGVVWSAPTGVNPTTGAFTGYTLDGLGPIPDVGSCDWSCTSGLTYDPGSNSCVAVSSVFILFGEGTPEASGVNAARLTDDPSTSHGLLKRKDAGLCPLPSPAGSSKSYDFTYQFGSNYNFSDSPTGPFPVVENGISACPPAPAPAPAPYTYAWFGGAYGACMGACGTTGTQTRTVVCKRSDGMTVADSFCPAPKPAVSQSCATAMCPVVTIPVCTADGAIPCVAGTGAVTVTVPPATACHNFSCSARIVGTSGYDVACWNQYQDKVAEWKTAGYMSQAAADDAISQGNTAWSATCQQAAKAKRQYIFFADQAIPTAGSPADLEQFSARFALDTEEYATFGGCTVDMSICPSTTPSAQYVWHKAEAGADASADSCSATLGQTAASIVEGGSCGSAAFSQKTCTEAGKKYYISCGTPLSVPAVCGTPTLPSSTCYQQGLCIAQGDVQTVVQAQGCTNGGTAKNISTASCGGSTPCSATWTCESPTSSSMSCGTTGAVAPVTAVNGACATPSDLSTIGNSLDNISCGGSTYIAVSGAVGNGGCASGTISSSEAVCDPNKRASWNWICKGSGGGSDSSICTASPTAASVGDCTIAYSVPYGPQFQHLDLLPGETHAFAAGTTYQGIGASLVRTGDTFTCPAAVAPVTPTPTNITCPNGIAGWSVVVGLFDGSYSWGQMTISEMIPDQVQAENAAVDQAKYSGFPASGVDWSDPICAAPPASACKVGTTEWTNDSCVGYPYGNAQLELVDTTGQGNYEWWQGTVDQGGSIYSSCSGRSVHQVASATIAALPTCGGGGGAAVSWQQSSGYSVQSEPLQDEGRCYVLNEQSVQNDGSLLRDCTCSQYYRPDGVMMLGEYHLMCEARTQNPPTGSCVPGATQDVYTSGSYGYYFGQNCSENYYNCEWNPGSMYFEHWECKIP